MFSKVSYISCLMFAIGVSLISVTTASAEGPKGKAVIKGKVIGPDSKMKGLDFGADQFCKTAHPKGAPVEGTIVYSKQGNALPYAFVYIKKGIDGEYAVPEEAVTINQMGCQYAPHVFGMIAGQGIDIVNSDKTNHNVHSLAKKNPKFNFAQAGKGMIKPLRGKDTFTRPEEAIKIKCDVHSWMSAYCFVLKHPFFDVSKSHADTKVKEERGTFEIKELPAGEYTVAAWHENYGELTQVVKVGDGETKEIEFNFGAKKAAKGPEFKPVEIGLVEGAPTAAKASCCASGRVAKAASSTPEK